MKENFENLKHVILQHMMKKKHKIVNIIIL
jgi:hypothetical protein